MAMVLTESDEDGVREEKERECVDLNKRAAVTGKGTKERRQTDTK